MIELVSGNLLENRGVDAIVNAVNTVGVMGKGIALQFKKAFPGNFREYEAACKRGEVQVGRVFLVDRGAGAQPRYILNFPTKKDWRHPSRYEYISQGLEDLVRVVGELGIGSLAVPAIGCGAGGLEWDRVLSMIRSEFADVDDVRVVVYAPAGAE